MRHICNAFALSMLSHSTSLNARRLSVTEASRLARGVDGVRVESAVGHAETAALFSTELGVPVEHRRVSVSLTLGSDLLVGQYTGPRLTEGATTLPAGATIVWWLVRPIFCGSELAGEMCGEIVTPSLPFGIEDEDES